MSYPLLLMICLFMMLLIATVMYYLGTKISYNYILYNASISIGSGVIFFLVKMVLTMDKIGPIEQMLDIVITMLLVIVWIVTLLETFTVEIMENGQEIKGNLLVIVNKVKAVDIKKVPSNLVRQFNIIKVKIKTYMVKNKFTVKVQKLIGLYIKNRELNKRV